MIEPSTDIPRLQFLATACYMDAYKEIHTEEQNRFSFQEMYSTPSLEEQLSRQHSRFFILTDQGTDQGYMALYPIDADCWMLDKLYVRPECKGHGYGGQLMRFALDYLRGLTPVPLRLVLKVNRRNQAVTFYRRHGFLITGQWDHPIADGRWIMDGYDMELTL